MMSKPESDLSEDREGEGRHCLRKWEGMEDPQDRT
jgi:hypothetical protein